MGLAYSSKCSLLYSYFYSLAPLFSFSFPHVFAPRVSLISPGHIASGILHCPFHPNISHSEFFIAHSIRMSHIRNSSPPSFHPDISHPEFFIAHSTRTSHIRNSSPPPLHSDISHPPFCPANIPPSPDVSQPPFCPANILPYPDVSHPDLKVNFFPPRGLKHVHLCMAAFPKSNCVNVFSDSGYFKIISNHQNFLSFILSIFL